MNVTDPDRKDWEPFLWEMNDNKSFLRPYKNDTLCDVYNFRPHYFNDSTLWNVSWDINESYMTNLNLTGQRFMYKASEMGTNLQKALLTEHNSQAIIYTAIIENDEEGNRSDVLGFDNETHDFQMLVGDDGHAGSGQDSTTPYYFYVELE
jgi:hypothetical protein